MWALIATSSCKRVIGSPCLGRILCKDTVIRSSSPCFSSTSPTLSQVNPTSTSSSSTTLESMDPQALASEFIQKSSNSRIPGTEAIESYLTPQQKRNNYLMAIGLLGFVGSVFGYSVYAVGGSRSNNDSKNDADSMNVEQILRAEAQEAQIRKIQEEKKEKQVQELVALDEELARAEGNSKGSNKQDILKKIQSLEGKNNNLSEVDDEMHPESSAGSTEKKPRSWRRFLMFWKKD